MSNTNHTPGPWTVQDNGMERISIHSSMSTVCVIDGASQWSANHTRENARLVAAAPDGLAANIKARDAILDLLGSGMVSTDGSLIAALRDAMNECNAAITKATI